jgi:hypothetical protein
LSSRTLLNLHPPEEHAVGSLLERTRDRSESSAAL